MLKHPTYHEPFQPGELFGPMFFADVLSHTGKQGFSGYDCGTYLVNGLARPCLRPVEEFFWWCVRQGVLIPGGQDFNVSFYRFRISARGRALLENLDSHPLSHGYLEGLK